MQMTQLITRLGRNDVKLIGRDRFLLMMFGFTAYMAIVCRFLLPWLNTYLATRGILPNERTALSLADYYPLIISYMAWFQGALMVGVIFGFMLLDEKDDNTLTAMRVTPVPLSQYTLYRVGLPVVIAAFITTAMVLFINQALVSWWQMILIAAAASLTAPMISLFFAIFAENKVQGLAYAKFVSLSAIIIVVGWFLPMPWQWLFGLFPPFLINKAYWIMLDGSGGWGVVLMLGVVLQLGLIWGMTRWFTRVVKG